MAVKRLSAETLIELAVETIKAELVPALPAEKRYTAAMVINALDIARRDVLADGEDAGWALLDGLYDDGDGSMRQLAGDIRTGRLPADKRVGLADKLRTLLIEELRIKNPRFLKSRGISA